MDGGRIQLQGLMRADVIVDLPPSVKGQLAFLESCQRLLGNDLGEQSAVEPFVLALGLGMVRR